MAEHSSTAWPGAGVGLQKHGQVLPGTTVPMPGAVDAHLGPRAVVQVVL